MSRKDTFKSFLFGGAKSEAAKDALSTVPEAIGRPRPASNLKIKTGPILHLAADLADKGEPIIEIEPSLIDASFIRDRLNDVDKEHEELVNSIRDHGQQVPVLLRPHPKDSARFQVVYGHRRVRACLALAKPVRAVVRALTDAQLVVAQGQENSARKALSYVERAFFAVRLNESGFDRDVIMAALNLSKSHLSTLMSVGRPIRAGLSEAVGPAPKAGEPRWSALASTNSRPPKRNSSMKSLHPRRLSRLIQTIVLSSCSRLFSPEARRTSDRRRHGLPMTARRSRLSGKPERKPRSPSTKAKPPSSGNSCSTGCRSSIARSGKTRVLFQEFKRTSAPEKVCSD